MTSILAGANSTMPNSNNSSMLLLIAGGIGGLAIGGTLIVCCVVCFWRDHNKGQFHGAMEGGGHAEEAKGEPATIAAEDNYRQKCTKSNMPKSNMLDDLATLIHLDPLPAVPQNPKSRVVAPRPQRRPSEAAQQDAIVSLFDRRATQRSCRVCRASLDDLTVYRDLALGGATTMTMGAIETRLDQGLCTYSRTSRREECTCSALARAGLTVRRPYGCRSRGKL